MKQMFTFYLIVFTFFLNEKAVSQDNYSSGANEPSTAAGSKLMSFQGKLNHNKVILQWTVAENETDDRFEVERSTDGKHFRLAALVFTSENSGNENYMFHENVNMTGKIYYRLKMYSKSGAIHYSKILTFQPEANSNEEIKIASNKISDKLTSNFQSSISEKLRCYRI